ncbi:hypothetical protein DFH27DRAFT_535995 [Peziza echinospora]|nr:hypothetical protein DFH27DRAFT_535995 [Peziza echinospora]
MPDSADVAGLAELPAMAQLPDGAELPDIVGSATDAAVQSVNAAAQAPAGVAPEDKLSVDAVLEKMDSVHVHIKEEPVEDPRVEASGSQHEAVPQGAEPEGLTEQEPPEGTEREGSTKQQQQLQPEGVGKEGKPEAIHSMAVDLDELFGDTDDMDQTDGYDSEEEQRNQTRTPPTSAPHTPATYQFQHQPGCPQIQHQPGCPQAVSSPQVQHQPGCPQAVTSPQVQHQPGCPQAHPQFPQIPQGFSAARTQEIMENIAVVKESISSNHTLAARFLGLQAAYRSIYSAMTHERSLREKAVMALLELQNQINKPNEISPQQIAHYTSRISQLSEEVIKERNHRIECEKSLVQYQSDMQKMKMRLDRHAQDLAKVERDAKIKCDAYHKEVDRHRMSVVSLMSENKSLQAKLKEGSMENAFTEKEAMQKEIEQLRNRVTQLEAINIRLKVGKSVLSKNDQDAHFNISSSLRSGNSKAQPATPQIAAAQAQIVQQPKEKEGTNDDVVFMGSNFSSRVQTNAPPSPQTSQAVVTSLPLRASGSEPFSADHPSHGSKVYQKPTCTDEDDDLVITGHTRTGKVMSVTQTQEVVADKQQEVDTQAKAVENPLPRSAHIRQRTASPGPTSPSAAKKRCLDAN